MYECVERLPYGLVMLRLDGVQQHIAELSPHGVCIRTMQPVAADAVLRLSFYRPEHAAYEHMDVEYEVESVRRRNGAVLTRLSFLENADVAATVRRVLADYAQYVSLRGEYGAAAYAAELGLYPADADGDFFDTIEAQRAAWHDELAGHGPLLPRGGELALMLDTPQLWQLYLDTPADGLLAAYACFHRLPDGLLPVGRPDRLYLGNAHCAQLFPGRDTLGCLLCKAREEGMPVTIVTSTLRERQIPAAKAMLAQLAEAMPGAEVVFNDWGMLMLLQAYRGALEPVLGTRLNARRKDPRMRYKAGMARNARLLAENALNDPAWRKHLEGLGVHRYEMEACGLPLEVPPGSHTVHLPYYQTNTSMYCPLRAYCETGDRGRQASDEGCPGYCRENGFLYPKHLRMQGRGNSLIALNPKADPALLKRFGRWVLNF